MKKLLFVPVIWLCLCFSSAWALPITVSFDVLASDIQVGDQFAVNLFADIPEPVLGFGLDVNYDPGILSLAAPPMASSVWTPVPAMDGDGLAGFAPFPTSVFGLDVLLATFTFDAIDVGISFLGASITLGDFSEGFPLAFPAPPGSFADVDFINTSVAVSEAAPVPEPSTLLLASVGLLSLLGYGRTRKN